MDQEYEKPETPDLVVKTVDCTVEESMLQVVELLEEHVSAACHLRLTESVLSLHFQLEYSKEPAVGDNPGFSSQHRQETSLFSRISKLASGPPGLLFAGCQE